MENYNKYGSGTRDVLITMAKNSGGEYGKEVLSGTSKTSSTGTYFRQILVIADAVFDDLYDDESIVLVTEGETTTEVDTMNTLIAGDGAVKVKAGTTLFGMFRNIKLTSGTVICYKEAPGGAGVKY